MWIAKDGRVRLELQAEKGDTQVLYDGHTVSIYDASSNTLYRYTVPARQGTASDGDSPGAQPDSQAGGVSETKVAFPIHHHDIPTVAKIEVAISLLQQVNVSGATPTDIAGQARLHGAHLSQRSRQPDRRRRARMGRRPRRPPARGDLLLDEFFPRRSNLRPPTSPTVR